MRVGYYVHHRGAGHQTRARLISGELVRRGHDVTLLGTFDGPQSVSAVALPRDDDDGPWCNPDAGGILHWAPSGHSGYQTRMGRIATWITSQKPAVVVVDVSVEVAALVRLLGVAGVLMAQPGQRDDAPHQLAYQLADRIIAPWPAATEPCPVLRSYSAKLVNVGGISRFSLRGVECSTSGPAVLLGGGDGLADVPAEVGSALPDTDWIVLGGKEWRDDVSSVLARAPLIVGHTGQNAVADVAALGKPLIMLPQSRPHDEQHWMARELDRAELAVPGPNGDLGRPFDWSGAAQEARDRAQRWAAWQTEGAVIRAADAIEEVAQ